MSRRTRRVLVRLVLVVGVVIGGFVALQGPVREAETWAATALLQALGVRPLEVLSGTTILSVAQGTRPFLAVLTPACSSLASVLAIGSLAALLPRGSRGRRLAAFGCAAGVVMAGNVVRIAASVAIGTVNGQAGLLLFHDWVGNAFTFAYTLGGFILMLFVLLPRRREVVGLDARLG